MKLGKRIMKSNAMQWVVVYLFVTYIRFVYWTTRWEIINPDIRDRFTLGEEPMIMTCWHGRIGMMAKSYKDPKQMHVLISIHRDGEMIARFIEVMGYPTVRGSTSKGGTEALRTMVKLLKNKQSVFFTPDGPRGPRMRAAPGIVTLARLTGAPMVPATFATEKRKVSKSWDRFVLPLPFGRGVFAYGNPIYVPRDADETAMERYRLQIETELTELVQHTDTLVGQTKIEPDPLPNSAETA